MLKTKYSQLDGAIRGTDSSKTTTNTKLHMLFHLAVPMQLQVCQCDSTIYDY